VQLQALLVTQGEEEGEGGASTEVFNGTLGKVSSFITTCKLYIRMKMIGVVVKEQIQWILSYV